MRKFFKYSFLIGCVLNALLLLVCRIIPNVNPFEQSFIGILGFLTPVFAIINVLFIVFWLITKKYWFTLIPFISLLFSWNIYSVTLAGHFFATNNFTKTDSTLSVMSYNVRLLNLYNWSKDKTTRQKILTLVNEQNTDVLCLQEFYTGNDSIGINNIKAITDTCHYPYYAECVINENKRGKWGSIIFSKYPIINHNNFDIDVAGSNLLQQVSISFLSDTISIYNVHLKSNKFSASETDLVAKNELPNWDEKTKSETKSIYDKLEKSSINRGLESKLVSRIIKRDTYKTIVCGDLNDIPSSYVYFQIRNKMKDAFLAKGLGLGATYNKFIPLLRIDYIFYTEQLNLVGFKKVKVDYSDHYPLEAVFKK